MRTSAQNTIPPWDEQEVLRVIIRNEAAFFRSSQVQPDMPYMQWAKERKYFTRR